MPYPVLPPDPPPLIATAAVTEGMVPSSVPPANADNADQADQRRVDPVQPAVQPLAIANTHTAESAQSQRTNQPPTATGIPVDRSGYAPELNQAVIAPASDQLVPPAPPAVFPPESSPFAAATTPAELLSLIHI